MKTFSEWLEQREELFLIDLNEGLNDLSVVKISRDLNIIQVFKLLKDSSYTPKKEDGEKFAKILQAQLGKIVLKNRKIPKNAPENIEKRNEIIKLFKLRFGEDYHTYLKKNNSTEKVFIRPKANAFQLGGPWAGAS